jgi:DNA-binding NarL/FixJ family response regulator
MRRRYLMARRDRITMDKQAQILKLVDRGYSVRGIASSLKMCRKAVKKYIERSKLNNEECGVESEAFPSSISG